MPLPDLDTGNVSFLAFWNALDNGATSIDPADTTGVFTDYTEYTNGVEGTVTVSRHGPAQDITVRARVKDDGWLLAWLTDTREFARTVESGYDKTGPYDLMTDWSYSRNNISPTQHRLERVVKQLRDSLSNSGNTNYSSGDVGLFNYEHPDATTITQASGQDGPIDSGTPSFGYTATWDAGTTVYDWVVAAATENNYTDTSDNVTHDSDDDSITVAASYDRNYEVGTYDALAGGSVTEGESGGMNGSAGSNDNAIMGATLVVWA